MTESTGPKVKPKRATEVDHTVGNRIALLRSASGMSQTMLAHALGISFQQVQKYETGKNRIGAGRLRAIADRLGVPVAVFFAEDLDDDLFKRTFAICAEYGITDDTLLRACALDLAVIGDDNAARVFAGTPPPVAEMRPTP